MFSRDGSQSHFLNPSKFSYLPLITSRHVFCGRPGVGGDEAGPARHAGQTGSHVQPSGSRENWRGERRRRTSASQTCRPKPRGGVAEATQTHRVCECLITATESESQRLLNGEGRGGDG